MIIARGRGWCFGNFFFLLKVLSQHKVLIVQSDTEQEFGYLYERLDFIAGLWKFTFSLLVKNGY